MKYCDPEIHFDWHADNLPEGSYEIGPWDNPPDGMEAEELFDFPPMPENIVDEQSEPDMFPPIID